MKQSEQTQKNTNFSAKKKSEWADGQCTIDVLVPAYNCEKYIKKCLDSLLNQSYKNIEIIVVDDGSTDSTAKIVRGMQSKHKNIVLYCKQNEGSISKTRNFLLTKIKSPLFTFFDSDDYAEPDYLEELYRLMVTYSADMSLCGKLRHREKKSVNLSKGGEKLYFMNNQEALCEMLSSNLYNGTLYCKLFKTELLGDSRFDENIHYGEDLWLCYQIMKRCKKMVLTSKHLYHYIIRDGSIVMSKFKPQKLTCLDCYNKIIEAEKDNPEALVCAKSMQGLIAIELLYYTWRDHIKNKQLKQNLKSLIKNSIPYIRQNKRLSPLLQKTPYVWWLTKIM